MDSNIKYKQVCRVGLYGDDDINTTTNSQYSLFPSSIPSISVVTSGSNYAAASTTVVLTSNNNNNSSGFSATANIVGGAVNTITINNGGYAFVSIPNITILSGVTNASGLVGGSNYNNNTAGTFPLIISGGGGSGAAGTYTVNASGVVASVSITSAGTGYSSAPTISITSGITGTSGMVAGSGYTNGTFNLIISGGGGSGAAGTFTVSGGAVNAVTITTAGYGYTSAPTLSFANSPNGSGASVSAILGTGASVTAVIGTGATAVVSGIYTNGKRMRFALNNSLNDLKLSVNARCIVEMCNIPSFQNMAGKYVVIRMVTSTQDKTCDTQKFLNGNPIFLSMATQVTLGSTNVLYNASEFFYNVNVPPNLFSNGYLDLEIEVPSATANIDFITSKPLNTFFLNFLILIIVDNDPELTKDLTLAPPIDYKNYNVNMPIRTY